MPQSFADRAGLRRAASPSLRCVSAMAGAVLLLAPLAAHSAVALLQPPRAIDGTKPLTLTLLITADDDTRRYEVPDTLQVTAVGDLAAPVKMELKRVDKAGKGPRILNLRRGDNRTVSYTADWPAGLRGMVRLDVAGIDAAPVTITLNRAPLPGEATPTAPVIVARPATATDTPAGAPTTTERDLANAQGTPMSDEAVTPVVSDGAAPAPVPADLRDSQRLAFNEPMYLLFGAHNGANAKFQISFRYRIFEGENPNSKSVLDNLYFAYTQFSLWDLASASRPFKDTNYRPSLYYYLSDVGVKNSVISRMSIATGFEHESNGRDGDNSRAVNTLFVKPTMYFGDQTDWHWRVAPKVYAYVGKSDNEDIAHYRGYMDLNIAYGRPDSWEIATTLRKGTRKGYGSIDAQLTYPLARLLPGTAGYLMAGYFYGWGESLLYYNQKTPWQFRIGYALSR
ncbi:phospholipase A [Cupriavidus agavae]|uniref:Phospholipase A1 n=1 Tax=Cupriavidus agavae TaxID=1001822 RepID=A0A4Q7S827_9BURK|nr:phospholipase A [Cupriavidus agavae]RZT42601.1 outer membrane phospholipase A [Cupriavidus agavae]